MRAQLAALAAGALVLPLGAVPASSASSTSCGATSGLYVLRLDGGTCQGPFIHPFAVTDVSADGSRVLGTDGAGVSDARLDGSDVRRLANGSAENARWSPDGAKVAFLRGNELWVMGADGSGLHRVAGDATEFAWARDSGRLAFVAVPAGRFGQITVVGATGQGRAPIAPWFPPPDCDASLTWAPHGGLIAYASSTSIFVVRPGRARRNLRQRGCSLAWSPGGRRLAFVAAQGLWVIGSDGRHLRRLDQMRGSTYNAIERPVWSSDGNLLAYTKHRDSLGLGPWQEQFDAVSLRGGRPRLIVRVADCSDALAWRWLPGRRLFVSVWAPGCGMD
ncbi:MAG TPA: hypothetical protein VF002_05995 [Gaiellaceae bacterium]